MTPGAMGKRVLDAHNAIVASCEALSELFGVPLPDSVKQTHRGGHLVNMLKQREGVAEFLGNLVGAQMPATIVADVIAQASDEELLALPGIGPATVEKLRGRS